MASWHHRDWARLEPDVLDNSDFVRDHLPPIRSRRKMPPAGANLQNTRLQVGRSAINHPFSREYTFGTRADQNPGVEGSVRTSRRLGLLVVAIRYPTLAII